MVTGQREMTETPMLIVEAGERATYAIPRAELGRFRLPPQRVAAAEAGPAPKGRGL